MHSDPMDWTRLGQHIRARRVALGYTRRRALAEAVGVHDNTLAKLEKGEAVGPNTLAAIENGLRWAPGSAEEILAGREPTESHREEPPAPPERPGGARHELVRQAIEEILALPEDVVSWQQKQRLVEIVMELGQEPGEPPVSNAAGNRR